MSKDVFAISTTSRRESTPHALGNIWKELLVQDQSGTDQQALDEKVNSMMEGCQKRIQNGKQRDGTPVLTRVFICKVCDKEGPRKDIRDHIESNHLEGISIPCDYCDKTFSSRKSLRLHNSRFHK